MTRPISKNRCTVIAQATSAAHCRHIVSAGMALTPALVLAAFLAMTTIAAAQAKAATFATECSSKDIAVLTLIEEQGAGGAVSSDRLSAAAMTMLLARSTCSAGRVGEALALYNSVLDLGPIVALSRQRP